jgi:hypothetical protein
VRRIVLAVITTSVVGCGATDHVHPSHHVRTREVPVTGAAEAVLMDCLMGAGFDPKELMAMTPRRQVELLRTAIADGRVPARAGTALAAMKRGPMSTADLVALVNRVNPGAC